MVLKGSLLLGVLAVVLTGCGGSGGDLPDAVGWSWTVGPIVTAADNPIAQALPRIDYRGGPFLRNPRLVTVTFAGDGLAVRLDRFGALITQSRWWRAVVDAYCAPAGDCIGQGNPATPVRLDEVPPARLHLPDVGTLLDRATQHDRLGRIDDQTLLLAYLPPGVTLIDERDRPNCTGAARAVHATFPSGRKQIPYAVVARCGDEAATTAAASHEILEATTNPDPSRPGFSLTPIGTAFAFASSGTEPVDPASSSTPGRNHSNSASRSGHCSIRSPTGPPTRTAATGAGAEQSGQFAAEILAGTTTMMVFWRGRNSCLRVPNDRDARR